MMVARLLADLLAQAEVGGKLQGHVTVVPFANPLGLGTARCSAPEEPGETLQKGTDIRSPGKASICAASMSEGCGRSRRRSSYGRHPRMQDSWGIENTLLRFGRCRTSRES
jgi:hypothetical protein